MKAHEMREMTLEELRAHLDALTEELANLRIRLAAKQLDNPMRVRQLRREIARAHTVLREKERGAKPGEKPGATRERSGERA